MSEVRLSSFEIDLSRYWHQPRNNISLLDTEEVVLVQLFFMYSMSSGQVVAIPDQEPCVAGETSSPKLHQIVGASSCNLQSLCQQCLYWTVTQSSDNDAL